MRKEYAVEQYAWAASPRAFVVELLAEMQGKLGLELQNMFRLEMTGRVRQDLQRMLQQEMQVRILPHYHIRAPILYLLQYLHLHIVTAAPVHRSFLIATVPISGRAAQVCMPLVHTYPGYITKPCPPATPP